MSSRALVAGLIVILVVPVAAAAPDVPLASLKDIGVMGGSCRAQSVNPADYLLEVVKLAVKCVVEPEGPCATLDPALTRVLVGTLA